MDSAPGPSVRCIDCNRDESMRHHDANWLRVQRHSSQPSLATSPHLSLKLKASLGNEAGAELIALVDRTADDISALRGDISGLHGDISGLHGDISGLHGDIAELRHQTELGFARVDVKFAQVDARFADMGRQIERQTNKLILWSFAFWVTTLLSIATLTFTSGP
jgi:hypothetical protein